MRSTVILQDNITHDSTGGPWGSSIILRRKAYAPEQVVQIECRPEDDPNPGSFRSPQTSTPERSADASSKTAPTLAPGDP